MDLKIKEILIKYDEQDCYETPSKFDYRKLVKRVAEFVNDIEKQFKLNFIIDNQVQDASFYCDIKIPYDLVKTPRPNLCYSIRVSNFGGLVTINFQEEYSIEVVSTIKNF